MKSLLVTGGCGFIGSHFVRLLIRKTDWRVVNLDKLTYAGNLENLKDVSEGERYRFARGDIADQRFVDALCRTEQPWAIVNFAAESHVDRSILDASPFIETNTVGVRVLLDAARRHGIERFVHISTDEVYGDADHREPATEESSLIPSSPYAASKAAADLLCLAYRRTYDLPVLVIRSCNTFGPYQFPEKLIPVMIRNALCEKDLPLYGDGLQRREWVYVDDNVEAILAVLEQGTSGSIYNVGTQADRTNLDVVHRLCRMLSEEAGMECDSLLNRIRSVPDRPGHDRRYTMDARKIRDHCGWTPNVPFDDGLKRTIRWYLDNREWVDRVVSGEYQAYYDAVYTRAWRLQKGEKG